jgi:hypothetical protein
VDARRLTLSDRTCPRAVRRLLLATVVALAACSGGTPEAAPSSTGAAPAEPALEAVSGYGRHAAVRAKADLHLANHGDAELQLTSLQVQHPLFEQLPAAARRTVLPPDGEVKLVPVPLGAPRCDRDDPAGAVLAVGVQTPDGVRDALVPLVDREPGLVRAHRLACAAAAVERLVTVELRTDGARTTTPSGPGLAMTLHLQRRAPGAVTVTELSGSILFTVAGTPPAPLLVLAPEADAAQAGVVLLASRCDQHALIESKTSFTFPLFARIDDGEPARLTTSAAGPARDGLQALLDDTCGAG